MEGKDTIMSDEEMKGVLWQSHLHLVSSYDAVAQAQAEISFKAGYETAEGELGKCYAPTFRDGKKVGIKEVVEYLSTKREGGYNFCVKISWDDWNAKLKKWGIDV